jgi:hypothetical protein
MSLTPFSGGRHVYDGMAFTVTDKLAGGGIVGSDAPLFRLMESF